MARHDDHTRDDDREREESQQTAGPRDNTDEATKADAGMTGTPAESYSPEGMTEDDDDASAD